MAVRRTSSALLWLFLGAGFVACGKNGQEQAARPRNLLLISLDTLRPDHLGCYGSPRETSPTIDALAARGVRFADASSAAPWTLPAHATMLTGLYPSHHGVKNNDNKLAAETTTLAEVLAANGFETFAVASTLNVADPRVEILQGFAPEHVRYVRETLDGPGKKQLLINSGPEVVAAARAFLGKRDPARPFFLFTHFYDAHTDFTPDAENRARFVAPYSGRLDGSTAQLLALRDRARLGADDVRHLRELYDAEIRQLDDVLGGFLAELEEQGLLAETLVVLTSDHGEEFYEHGGLLHGRTQYEELLRVPLIFVGPGVPAGQVVAAPVSLVDLMPTVLGRFGLAPTMPLDGLDLAPSWSGTALPQRMLFGEADHNNVVAGKPVDDIKRSARLGSEKLHLDRLSGKVQLFDLASDPAETRDLAAGAPERVELLRASLARFLDGAVAGAATDEALSRDNAELLRDLGYAGGEEDAAAEPKKHE